ncbi:MAG: hypothetical protein IJQ53_03225 [Clostridia bacterium]|nr:hypothetical protein [Clostridia bacterium]
MKKFAVIFIALMLVLSLAACGNSGSGGSSGAVSGTASGNRTTLEGIISGTAKGEVFRPDSLTAEEREALRKDIEANGGKVDFGVDGSIKIEGADKSRYSILPDGTIEGVDDQGVPFSYNPGGSTKWPSSGYAANVPAPGFNILASSNDEHGFTAVFTDVSYEDAKAYAAKLRAAGFNADIDERELKDEGMYSYEASNSEGIRASLMYAKTSDSNASCSLSVGKVESDYSFGDDPWGDESWWEESLDLNVDFSDTWPTGGIAAKLPKANFGTGYEVETDEYGTDILISGATEANFKAYAQQLKNAGFTVEADEGEEDGVLYYEANDADGFYAYVAYAPKEGLIEIGIEADEYDDDYDDDDDFDFDFDD